jgi:hypothetical protein
MTKTLPLGGVGNKAKRMQNNAEFLIKLTAVTIVGMFVASFNYSNIEYCRVFFGFTLDSGYFKRQHILSISYR